jgi:hypothetical protein
MILFIATPKNWLWLLPQFPKPYFFAVGVAIPYKQVVKDVVLSRCLAQVADDKSQFSVDAARSSKLLASSRLIMILFIATPKNWLWLLPQFPKPYFFAAQVADDKSQFSVDAARSSNALLEWVPFDIENGNDKINASFIRITDDYLGS